MLGTVVNAAAIVVGALLGMLIKGGLAQRFQDTLMKGLGLVTLYIAISGCLIGEHTLMSILSIVFGSIVGEACDLDARLKTLALWFQKRLGHHDTTTFAQGFISGSLLFCVGAMAIMGALESGLHGNHEILFAKATIDFVAAIVFASTMGIGVAFSGGMVFLYQGFLTLLAMVAAPYISTTVVNEMACVGYILLMGVATNLLDITKLKVMNYVPAIFFPIVLSLFM